MELSPTSHQLGSTLNDNFRASRATGNCNPITVHSSTNRAHTPGAHTPGDLVRELLALPAHLGGMGLINPAVISAEQHPTSKLISAPLVEQVLRQDHQLIQCHAAKQDIRLEPTLTSGPGRRRKPGTCRHSFQLPFNAVWIIPMKREL